MMGIAVFTLGSERFIERLFAHGAGDGRAIRETVEERGIIRTLRNQCHQHGENRLLSGDIVEEYAALKRIGDMHGVLGGKRRGFKGILQVLHVAQHEGEQALIAGHGIGA